MIYLHEYAESFLSRQIKFCIQCEVSGSNSAPFGKTENLSTENSDFRAVLNGSISNSALYDGQGTDIMFTYLSRVVSPICINFLEIRKSIRKNNRPGIVSLEFFSYTLFPFSDFIAVLGVNCFYAVFSMSRATS